MFDIALFLVLSACATVAIVAVTPGQVRAILAHRSVDSVPPRTVMIGAAVQQSVLAMALAAVGTALAPRSGLSAPWFSAVVSGRGAAASELMQQIVPALLVGGLSTVVFLGLYYGVFRPRMNPGDVERTESMRREMGLLGRLLMGGVAEEIMFRWGIMSLFAWLALAVAGLPETLGMWLAIILSGLLFGLGHLPGAAAAGVKVTRFVVVMAVALNLIVGLACGWLLWQYGLVAAMVAHALVHLAWHPLEVRARPT